MRVLAEIMASDVSLFVTFNHAIDGVIQNNPKTLAQLDGYKWSLVSFLSGGIFSGSEWKESRESKPYRKSSQK